jgi:hypothetical protein
MINVCRITVVSDAVGLSMDLCSKGRSKEVIMPEVHEGMVFKQNIFLDSKEDVKSGPYANYRLNCLI